MCHFPYSSLSNELRIFPLLESFKKIHFLNKINQIFSNENSDRKKFLRKISEKENIQFEVNLINFEKISLIFFIIPDILSLLFLSFELNCSKQISISLIVR